MPYRPLTTDDRDYPLADPSVATMRALYALEVRTPFTAAEARLDVCRVMGWPPERAAEDLPKDVYLAELARVLFPTAATALGDGDGVSVPEVLRARADFLSALR